MKEQKAERKSERKTVGYKPTDLYKAGQNHHNPRSTSPAIRLS